MKKGYKKLLKIWRPAEIAALLCITAAAVYNWRHRGVPHKYWQKLCDESGGKIKSVRQLKG